MGYTTLEHINITVSDARKTTHQLCQIFGWTQRWSGPVIRGGFSYHIGNKDFYLSVYQTPDTAPASSHPHLALKGLNHIGIVVDSLDIIEARVKAAGFTPENHADYAPGKRFYFIDHDGIEFEVVSYATDKSNFRRKWWSYMVEISLAVIARK